MLILLRHMPRFRPFGPVLFYEMVRTARRGRYVWLRFAYAILILLAVWAVYQRYSPRLIDIPYYIKDRNLLQPYLAAEMARFAEAFFSAFMCVQLFAVVLLTPAYTAGAVAEEKDRKTLEFLLATDLNGRQIVLSKLAACLGNLMLLIMTGLPILALTQLLGGVDPGLLVAGFLATGLTMLSLAAVSILNSVYASKARDAIVMSYLTVLGYLMLSIFSAALIPSPTATARLVSPWRDAWDSLMHAVTCGNPIVAIFQLQADYGKGTPLAQLLPPLVRDYAIFHGWVTFICIAWAVARVRKAALNSPHRSARARVERMRHWLRPKLGRQPMIWKEVFAEPGLAFNWFGRVIVGLIILVSFAPALWIIGRYSLQYASHGGFYVEALKQDINVWVRLVGTTVATLTLLGVAVRAASSISGERDRQTLDSLLTTHMELRAILWAKWLGSLLSVRWAWVWLCLVWAVGVFVGGLHIVTLPWLLLAWLIYAAFVAQLGMRFSITSPSTLRATLVTLAVLAALSFGHWVPRFFWQAPRQNYYGSAPPSRPFVDFQTYALTPPMALGWLAFRGDDLDSSLPVAGSLFVADPWSALISIVVGLTLWGMAALVLRQINVKRFASLTGRTARRRAREPASARLISHAAAR
jgi:ABC-type Na+ efflux pump permease subunit